MSSEQADIAKKIGSGRAPRGKWIAIIVIAVAVAAALFFYIRGKVTKAHAGPQYKTVQIQKENIHVIVTATGTLEPVNTVDVGTEVSGTVASVLVDYNDVVTKGQILARLDTAKLEAQAAQTRAALESARAKLLQAEAEARQARQLLDRYKEVSRASGGKTPSQSDIDQQEATFKTSQAGVASARATVQESQAALAVDQTNLTKAVIRSPINGIVLTRSVDPGQTVAASLSAPTLFELAEDLTKMDLYADVDEADVGQVREGQEATFTVDAYPDEEFVARVRVVRFSPTSSSGVVTYTTLLAVENKDQKLRPGMTATAQISVETVRDTLAVPNTALRYQPTQTGEPQEEEGKSLFMKIMPFPRRHGSSTSQPPAQKDKSNQPVWVLKNGRPVSILLKLGVTDGKMTQVVSGQVQAQTPVIVEEVKAPK